ncbi:bifunctional 4-hydroxy-2-oxoglutarate aldolase/2-dehydro-3-deoxy-phosphogluconate aldolase [Rhodovulum sp. DZ06]|uniref:bifunctional 4-hydroxy-2-oxoglutarate aldolase/2-dehydro-3-deoxy-phosphogluconate aldolase n=1 Tax=Rhodovulum sp. DZ06 TaxID=3425126 RepID=UPI003D34FBCE
MTEAMGRKTPEEICALAPLIPVITVEKIEQAAPLAKALYAGGLRALEVTLRTDCALEAIKAMRAAVPEASVGAGTLRDARDVMACLEAGVDFGVSPGSPAGLMEAVAAAKMPFLPGCASPTEAMTLADKGFKVVKFFPAEAAGGVPMLKSMAAPLPDIKVCPTGGVSIQNAPDYLKLPNVAVVGGSWICPMDAVRGGDWDKIERLCAFAVEALAPYQQG